MKYWLLFERAVHRVDAYLARNRDDINAYRDALSKEAECTRLLDRISIQS